MPQTDKLPVMTSDQFCHSSLQCIFTNHIHGIPLSTLLTIICFTHCAYSLTANLPTTLKTVILSYQIMPYACYVSLLFSHYITRRQVF